MSVIGTLKEAADLIQKGGNMDLYKRILEVEVDLIEKTHENHKLAEKIIELEKLQSLRATLTFRAPFYYLEGDATPNCARCWESDQKLIHLTGPTGEIAHYLCPQCHGSFSTGERSPTRALRRRPFSDGRGF